MNIAGQAAIVVGGASGLGAATARELASGGSRVSIFDLDVDKGRRIADELSGVFAQVDITDSHSIEQGIALAAKSHGPARILVNCAGVGGDPLRTVGRDGPYPIDRFKRVVDINLIGTFDATRLVAHGMVDLEPLERGERGVVINVSSINAQDAPVGNAAYVASKAAVEALTLTIARDLGPRGIRAVTLAPGSFDTPMFRQIPNAMLGELLKLAPFPNDAVGDPADFARLARHVCENIQINGTVIRIDAAVRHSMVR